MTQLARSSAADLPQLAQARILRVMWRGTIPDQFPGALALRMSKQSDVVPACHQAVYHKFHSPFDAAVLDGWHRNDGIDGDGDVPSSYREGAIIVFDVEDDFSR